MRSELRLSLRFAASQGQNPKPLRIVMDEKKMRDYLMPFFSPTGANTMWPQSSHLEGCEGFC